MNILITKNQLGRLLEQSDYMIDKRTNAIMKSMGRSEKDYQTVDKAIEDNRGKGDIHDIYMVLGVASAFIPYVGPYISTGIGLFDAQEYRKEGDEFTADLIEIFSVLPIIGSVLSRIPFVKKLGAKGMAKIISKLKSNKPLDPIETAALNEVKSNVPEIQKAFKTASDKLAETVKEIKELRVGYIERYGKDNYDNVLGDYITGKTNKEDFLNILKEGQLPNKHLPLSRNVKFKFNQLEISQIDKISKTLKTSMQPEKLYIDGANGKVVWTVEKYNKKDLPKYFSPEDVDILKKVKGSVFEDENKIVFIVDNLSGESPESLASIMYHEISHVKDPATLKSPKLKQSYKDAVLNKKYNDYYFHRFEINANVSTVIQVLTDNVQMAKDIMTKEEILDALKNLILFSGGNVGNLSPNASLLIFGKTKRWIVTQFFEQLTRNPSEYKKFWDLIRKQAMNLIQDIKISM